MRHNKKRRLDQIQEQKLMDSFILLTERASDPEFDAILRTMSGDQFFDTSRRVLKKSNIPYPDVIVLYRRALKQSPSERLVTLSEESESYIVSGLTTDPRNIFLVEAILDTSFDPVVSIDFKQALSILTAEKRFELAVLHKRANNINKASFHAQQAMRHSNTELRKHIDEFLSVLPVCTII